MRKARVVAGVVCLVVGAIIATYGYLIDPGDPGTLEPLDKSEVVKSRTVLAVGGVLGLAGLILIALGFDRVHSSPRS